MKILYEVKGNRTEDLWCLKRPLCQLSHHLQIFEKNDENALVRLKLIRHTTATTTTTTSATTAETTTIKTTKTTTAAVKAAATTTTAAAATREKQNLTVTHIVREVIDPNHV